MHNVRAASEVLFGAKCKLQPGRWHLSELWQTAPQRPGERSVGMWFWWRGSTCNQARIFLKASVSLMKTLLVTRNSVTMKDISVFPDMRRDKNWAQKISSWEHLMTWRPDLLVSPLSRESLISAFHPQLLQGYWRPAAAAAHDSILMEVDDMHSWQGPVCSWHYKCSRDALIKEHTSVI